MLGGVRNFILLHNMLISGDLIVVAVSGGPDSVALLHALHTMSEEFQIKLHVFHLDHGLRGDDSAADALYVRRLADRLGVPSTIVGLGPEVLKRRGGSLQAAARVARMQEIEILARRIGASKVATGHNRNDQAETVLMRVLRGTGIGGLAGIRPVRLLNTLTYVRPLLDTPRGAIQEYCLDHELSPQLDESNLRPDYMRNRVRLDLLPRLAREFNPALPENLYQMATVLRDEDQLLDSLAVSAVERCRAPGERGGLVGSALLKEPLALARRVVRMVAREVAGSEVDLGLASVTQVLEVAARAQGSHELHLPYGLRVVMEYGICMFIAETGGITPMPGSEWPISLVEDTNVPELGLRVVVRPSMEQVSTLEAAFDVDRLPGPVAIRFRRPGDRLWPTGMEGSKKLQDILVDAKVPQRVRDRIPLLVSGDEILWVIGYRLDRRYLASRLTQTPVVLRVVPADRES